MRGPASALLTFEILVVLLAGLLAATSTERSAAAVWSLVAVAVGLCLAGAATLRRPTGWVFGSAAQVAVTAYGVVVPAMFFLGALFAGLWVLAWVLDHRLRRAAEVTR